MKSSLLHSLDLACPRCTVTLSSPQRPIHGTAQSMRCSPYSLTLHSAWHPQAGVLRVLGSSRWAGEAEIAPELVHCRITALGVRPWQPQVILSAYWSWKRMENPLEPLGMSGLSKTYPPRDGAGRARPPHVHPFLPYLTPGRNAWPDQRPDPLACSRRSSSREDGCDQGPRAQPVDRAPWGHPRPRAEDIVSGRRVSKVRVH